MSSAAAAGVLKTVLLFGVAALWPLRASLAQSPPSAPCEPVSAWMDSRGSPEVRQLNSSAVLVDWSGLWSGRRWAGCVAEAFVAVEGDGGEAEDVRLALPEGQTDLAFAVRPCAVTRFSLKLLLSDGAEVSSFRSQRGFKTFLPPLAKAGVPLEGVVRRGVRRLGSNALDLTAASVELSFFDLVEDPACRRVTATELRFKLADEDEEDDGVWTVVKTIEAKTLRRLEETVPDLHDLCSAYDVALELVGTPGTGGALVRLATLPPPSTLEMAEAWESGFRWRMETPRELQVVERSHDGLSVGWVGPDYSCLSGYIVRLRDSAGDILEVRGVDSSGASFSDLSPCRSYSVEVASYVQIDDDPLGLGRGRKFESEFVVLGTSTLEESGGMTRRLSSLNVLKGRTYVTLSWLSGEWGACLGSLKAWLCRPAEVADASSPTPPPTNFSTCFGPTGESRVGDREVASFHRLEPCVAFRVIILPASSPLPTSPASEGGARTSMFESSLSMTTALHSAPRQLRLLEEGEAHVTVEWEADSCALAYFLTLTHNATGDALTYWFDAENLLLMEQGEESTRIKRDTRWRRLDYDSSDAEYDFESYLENEADDYFLEEEEEGSGEPGEESSLLYDDEDFYPYEASGDGDETGRTENKSSIGEQEDKEDKVNVTIRHLMPCSQYAIKVQNVYSDDEPYEEAAEVIAWTECPDALALNTTASDNEGGEDGEEFANFEMEMIGATKVRIEWDQRPLAKNRLLIVMDNADEPTIHDEVYADASHVEALLELQSCRRYDIRVVNVNEAEELVRHQEDLMMPPAEEQRFQLVNSSVEVLAGDNVGTALLSWRHVDTCVDQYRLRLSSQTASGEMLVPAPREYGAVVSSDLNMVPGVLSLANCLAYTVTVSPQSAVSSQLAISDWYLGATLRFQYVTADEAPPNNAFRNIFFAPTDSSIAAQWTEAISCAETQAGISVYRMNSSTEAEEKDLVSSWSVPKSGREFVLGDLSPCTDYKVSFTHGEEELFSRLVTTHGGGGAGDPPASVSVDAVSQDSANVSWSAASPCPASFLLIWTDDEGEQATSSVDGPSAVLAGLKPCTQYSLQVWSKVDGHLSASSSDAKFATNTSGVSIVATAEHDSIALKVLQQDSDCFANMLVSLCESGSSYTCRRENLTLPENTLLFDELMAGTEYSYFATGVDLSGEEVFATPQGVIRTKTKTMAVLSATEITDSMVTLDIIGEVFSEDETLQVVISCDGEDGSNIFSSTALLSWPITMRNLSAYSSYNCSGELQSDYDKQPIRTEEVSFQTLQGVPAKPTSVDGQLIDEGTYVLSWKQPEESNGILESYQVVVKGKCVGHLDFCNAYCSNLTRSFVLPAASTFVELPVVPYVSYRATISAKTSNPQTGDVSDEYTFDTEGMLSQALTPSIVKVKAGSGGNSIRVDFAPACPPPPTVRFSARYECTACRSQPEGRTRQVGETTFQISGLEGGHYYEVWVQALEGDCSEGSHTNATAASCVRSSAKKVVFLDCEFRCSDGTCINRGGRGWRSIRCDFVADCPDGSDEDGCVCEPPDRFKCRSGYCIPFENRCDGKVDCNDLSDETECPECGRGQFQCESGECIPQNATCDRQMNCKDGSDETGCAYWESSCWPGKFRCLDHTCVGVKHRCDGIWDCVAGEDELSCNMANRCKWASGSGGGAWQFACRDGRQCVDMRKYCDGVPDCQDGSDERWECRCHRNGQFACSQGDQCVSRLKVCDGISDCQDASDESACGALSKAGSYSYEQAEREHWEEMGSHSNGHIMSNEITSVSTDPNVHEASTHSSNWTVSAEYSYDHVGEEDYDDDSIRAVSEEPLYDLDLESANLVEGNIGVGSYENAALSNNTLHSPYRVRVYPERQWVREGDDAVLQCRDEGDLRARVRWRRKEVGKKLPGGSRSRQDDRGRLTLWRLRRQQAGEYVCFVVGKEDAQAISLLEIKQKRT